MERSVNGRAGSTQKVVLEEEVAVVVETADETKLDDVSLGTSVEKQLLKKTHGRIDPPPNSSNSDDESEIADKSSLVMESEEWKEKKVVDTDVNANSATSADLFESQKFEEMAGPQGAAPAENSMTSGGVTEFVVKSVEEKVLLASDENGSFSTVVTETVSEGAGLIEEKALPNSEDKEVEEKALSFFDDEKTELPPVGIDPVTKELGSIETIIPQLSHEKSAEESSSSFLDSAVKENFNEPLHAAEVETSGEGEHGKRAGEEIGFADVASKENVDSLLQPADVKASGEGENSKNTEKSSDLADLASEENGSSLLEPDTSSAQPNRVAEEKNESENPQSTEYQPIISMPPGHMQRTSWRSCCGLFDVLRRSSS